MDDHSLPGVISTKTAGHTKKTLKLAKAEVTVWCCSVPAWQMQCLLDVVTVANQLLYSAEVRPNLQRAGLFGVFVRLVCGALWLLFKCAGYKHSYSLTRVKTLLVDWLTDWVSEWVSEWLTGRLFRGFMTSSWRSSWSSVKTWRLPSWTNSASTTSGVTMTKLTMLYIYNSIYTSLLDTVLINYILALVTSDLSVVWPSICDAYASCLDGTCFPDLFVPHYSINTGISTLQIWIIFIRFSPYW